MIHRAIYGWVVFSVFCYQQTTHQKEGQTSGLLLVLLSNFPATAVRIDEKQPNNLHKMS